MSSVLPRLAGFAAALLLAACDAPPRDPSQLTTIRDTYAGVDTIVRQVVGDNPGVCTNRSFAARAFIDGRPGSPVQTGTSPTYPASRLYGVDCTRMGPILVATIADTNNLNQASPFGRIVSEQIETRLTQQGFHVVEAHMAGSMVMNANGQFMLSRDLRALARQQNAGTVLVGTYLDAQNQALVNLKLVRVADDTIVAASDFATWLPLESRTQLMPVANSAPFRPLFQGQ